MHSLRFILWCLFVAMLIACQTQTVDIVSITPSPPPNMPFPTFTATAIAATAAAAPTLTLPPLFTPTALTSPTAVATINNTPTPTPTLTQPEGFIGPYTFPPNTNPLTGEVVNPEVLNHRPLAIKISNYPPLVRPQWGLNSADLLFEHYAEGGFTRFTAVFYSHNADRVGSIRSGRLIDIEIPQMYDAAFAYSGSSGPVREMLHNSNFFGRIISPDFAHGGFERIPEDNKAFEHTLYTDTYTLRFLLEQRGEDRAPSFPVNMAFSSALPANGTAAEGIEIHYQGTNVYWDYQPTTKRYLRWTDGQPHLDAATGMQLNFKNIIILGANHVNTDILEDFVGGGNLSIQIQIWGEGPVSIFRDGERFEGRWKRESPDHMLTFYDQEGNWLPLTPGNSFFQIVPLGFDGLIVTP